LFAPERRAPDRSLNNAHLAGPASMPPAEPHHPDTDASRLRIVELPGRHAAVQFPTSPPTEEIPMRGYTIHVNLSCTVSSLNEARERMARLAEELPELFRVVSFSVWSPDGDMPEPHEQLLSELRQIVRDASPDEMPPRRRH